jgi:hypothetical protein
MHPDFEDEDALPEPLADVHRRLLHDGDQWRATLPADHLLRMARALDTTSTASTTGGIMNFDSAPIYPLIADQRISRKGWRSVIPIAAAVVLVALSAVVFTVMRPYHPNNTGATPPTAAAAPYHPSVIAPKPQNLHLPVPSGSTINALSMATADDGWAAGGYLQSTGGSSDQYTEAANIRCFFIHFHDGVWSLAPDTFPSGDIVESLVMISPNDGWAAGFTYTPDSSGKPLIWHFTGGHWQLTTIPVLPEENYLIPEFVAAPTPDFVWISVLQYAPKTAATTGMPQQLFLIYHAGTWAKIFAHAGSTGSLVSPEEGWVLQQVGFPLSSTSTVHFLHYQQGTWTDVMQVSGLAISVTMLSAQDGWAMVVPMNGSELAENNRYYHYTGTSWQQATLRGPEDFQPGVYFPIAPDEVWLAGRNSAASKTEWVYHGQAQILPLPQPYDQTVQITADGDGGVWAIASHPTNQGHQGPDVILYDLHGVWTIYGIGG